MNRALPSHVRRLLLAACAGLMIAGCASAPRNQEPYDPQRAGHPLRVAAYVAHPVGFALDWLVFRPAYWIGSHQPFRAVFGRTENR